MHSFGTHLRPTFLTVCHDHRRPEQGARSAKKRGAIGSCDDRPAIAAGGLAVCVEPESLGRAVKISRFLGMVSEVEE